MAKAYLDEIGALLLCGRHRTAHRRGEYRTKIVQELIARGAEVHAKHRRGAEPLHAAAVGMPGSHTCNPSAQVATIARLIEAGADANAVDISGVTPLHRAVRTRCAAAAAPMRNARTSAARRQCCSRPRTQAAAAPAHRMPKRSKRTSCAYSSGTSRGDHEWRVGVKALRPRIVLTSSSHRPNWRRLVFCVCSSPVSRHAADRGITCSIGARARQGESSP
jgi:ankyrin repeat protein